MLSSGEHVRQAWLNRARRTGDMLDEQYIKNGEELRREVLKICPSSSPGLQKKFKNSSLHRFYYCSLIYLISTDWAVFNAWIWRGSLAGKGALDQPLSCFSAASLLGSKFVTSKKWKDERVWPKLKEIQGVLLYVHLKDGQVAKPETQRWVSYG